MARNATSAAMIGDSTAGTTTLATIEWPWIAEVPAETSVAPITPPISACEDEDGSPKDQVTMFQTIAPSRPANTIGSVIAVEATMPPAMVAATFNGQECAGQVQHGRQRHGGLRLQRTGRDRGRHRVGGVVETIGEIKGKRGDHNDEQQGGIGHRTTGRPGAATRAATRGRRVCRLFTQVATEGFGTIATARAAKGHGGAATAGSQGRHPDVPGMSGSGRGTPIAWCA